MEKCIYMIYVYCVVDARKKTCFVIDNCIVEHGNYMFDDQKKKLCVLCYLVVLIIPKKKMFLAVMNSRCKCRCSRFFTLAIVTPRPLCSKLSVDNFILFFCSRRGWHKIIKIKKIVMWNSYKYCFIESNVESNTNIATKYALLIKMLAVSNDQFNYDDEVSISTWNQATSILKSLTSGIHYFICEMKISLNKLSYK